MGEEPRSVPVQAAVQGAAQFSNTKELGKLVYSQYLYPLQIAAVLLLVAIIAAIALTLRKRKDSKYTNPSEQVRVRARDRLRIVQIAPTRVAPSQSAAAETKA
jgi:NADH-quinone oxidoreductase subunit J